MTIPDDEIAERLDEQLMGVGIYVQDVETDEEVTRVEYETVAPGDGVPHRQMGRVINALRGQDGWERTAVRGAVRDGDDGSLRGTWRAEREWLAALEAGELSQVDFSAKVIDSIEE